ncbi:MAG: glycosyltransferase, partial [Vicinamibacterales bacterium]
PTLATRLIRSAAAKAACMGAATGPSRVASHRRLQHMRETSEATTYFLAPSRTLRERFLEFGIPADRIAYREQGIDQTTFRRHERTQSARLRIGFVGSLMVSKAPHVLLEAFAALPPDSATLHIFGTSSPYHGDDSYQSQLEPLLRGPGVERFGGIPHENVPAVLASLDVIVTPSVWIENAPFVIREAFAAGVPVIASNLGGMAELVSEGRNGLLFEAGNVADLRRVLLRLIHEPDLLPTLRAGVQPGLTIQEDVTRTREIYARLTRVPIARGQQ